MAATRFSATAEVGALNHAAWQCQYTDPARALEHALRGVALAQELNDQMGLAYALLNKALHELSFCPVEQAEATLLSAHACFDALNDPRGLMLVQTGRGGCLLLRNEIDAAQQVLEEVMRAPESIREPLDAYYALYRLGYIHFHRGEVQEGLRYYYNALGLVQHRKSLPLACQALSDLGSAQMELANYDEARNLLEQAFEISKTVAVSFRHLIIANLASVHLETGNPAAALALIEDHIPGCSTFFRAGERAFLDVVAAQAYAALGRWDEALPLAEAALTESRSIDDLEITNQSLWMRGVIENGMGHQQQALTYLLDAERGFDKVKNVFYILHVYRALADTYRSLDQCDLAYGYLDTFHRAYEAALGSSSKARFFTLQIQHELARAELERDYALQQHSKLEEVNLALLRKIDEVEALQAALHEQAVRDPLTGLYNRRFLDAQLTPMLELAGRNGHTVCVVLIDVDHFKRVNDDFGHAIGDQVLVKLSDLLLEHMRSSDLAVRYGGEEFCLVFPVATAADTDQKLRTLLQQFQAFSLLSSGHALTGQSFSAGIAEFPHHGVTADTLLKVADTMLYRAKSEGRARILLAS
ncbi:two-component system cell cycle response regulator [Actimicrobium sp. GrIS 1.19]|uniref:tetratricopeptide repeat-containing diguanylate cyclase n=1 Tax=Actimicrobium sp. GrIS 1.19 TaxID=3071708 RepID=UPI002DFB7FE9|nr:two-component system cell cycle response regulator [Actimicrobium sp. GrIS 1.19]